jgi:hypothetical protein
MLLRFIFEVDAGEPPFFPLEYQNGKRAIPTLHKPALRRGGRYFAFHRSSERPLSASSLLQLWIFIRFCAQAQ